MRLRATRPHALAAKRAPTRKSAIATPPRACTGSRARRWRAAPRNTAWRRGGCCSPSRDQHSSRSRHCRA
eukprot:1292723-Prymnesium_polylepis.2